MALCTSCGNEVEESASFCTSCGKPMPASAQPSAAVTVTRPVCSSCGAQGDPDSAFCTECGHRLATQPVPVVEAGPVSNVAAPAPLEAKNLTKASAAAWCTSCGTKIEPGTGFCTNCGQPVAGSSAVTPEPLTSAAHPAVSPAPEPAVAVPAPVPVEPTRAAVAAASPFEHYPVKPAPQVAAPLYATPSDYQPAKPGGGAFRAIVLVLLLLIVVGGFGSWYFMGVETVIVCSPPDVTVFLDGKELAPASYGRYVIPHLSRQPHLLRVQRPGFGDTIERLDFPLASLHEWVNIKLVPRRPSR
jgi:predicted amidophosphoribosyltransferase